MTRFLPLMAIATGSTFTTKDVHEPALGALRRDTTEYSLALLRYDLATEMNAAGANDRRIQAQLRHSDSAITRQVYIRDVPADVASAVDSLFRSTLQRKANEASNEAYMQK